MRQLLTKYIHEGIGFSKNAHEAFLNGEKPEILFTVGSKIFPTRPHHIEIKVGNTFKRPLVMFYREV